MLIICSVLVGIWRFFRAELSFIMNETPVAPQQLIVDSIKALKFWNSSSQKALSIWNDTVDGQNPAPVDRQPIPLCTGSYKCFTHPRWCRISSINSTTLCKCISCPYSPYNLPSNQLLKLSAHTGWQPQTAWCRKQPTPLKWTHFDYSQQTMASMAKVGNISQHIFQASPNVHWSEPGT